MITLFSGLIHGVGLYILVVSSVFFGIVLQDLMNFASKINDINRCFVCGCETVDENCCRIAGLAGRHKLIPCSETMHLPHASVSSFCPVSTGMNANFIQDVIGVFLQRDFRQELKVLFILEKSSVLGDGQLVCKGNEPTMVRRRAPSTPLVRGGTMAVVIERFKQ